VRPELLEYLVCSSCKSELAVHSKTTAGDHVMAGTLSCTGCARVYPIVRGVPRLNVAMDGLERVAQTFSYQWRAHHAGELERRETLWGFTLQEDWSYFLEATGVKESDLAGAVVLDAGCGSGRLTRLVAEHGPRTVIGVDIIDAVDGAFEASRHLPNVHIVQGNLFQLPFRTKAFDLVWSNGVIHHTPNARAAHEALSEMPRPGGVLYVWVYAKRFNPFRFTRDVMEALGVTRLPEPLLLRLSRVLAYISVVLHGMYKAIRRIPLFRPRTRWAVRTMRQRTADELSLTWFDTLSPEHNSRHSEAEVVSWFERLGFRDVAAIEEPKVGVRGVAP
jgi:SAM-dependent methyltransferase/uncharacterized protein YbaR (Trm112 family)